MAKYDVAVLIGSLNPEGLSARLAGALRLLAPSDLAFREISIRELALYDDRLEGNPPSGWTEFRESVCRADALLFITPEYNRSIPGGLKNALDVGSRPYGSNVFDSKPACIVSHSSGSMGGFGANHALRQSLVFLNVPTLAQPELYIAGSNKMFDGDNPNSDATRELLTRFLDAFQEWIVRHIG